MTYNLTLVRQATCVSDADFADIAALVRQRAPDIDVAVVLDGAPVPQAVAARPLRPTLTYSNMPLQKYRPPGGTILRGRMISKMDQTEAFLAAGVPVPRSAVLTPDLELDPAEWGDYVIIKPTDLAQSSRGDGVALMRTERVAYRAPADYPADHPGRAGPMIVQRFINTGLRPNHFRVLTFFGATLYGLRSTLASARAPLTSNNVSLESAVVASQGGQRMVTFFTDPQIEALAQRVHAAIPDVPLKGTDIVRDAKTGELFVLECNPGGNTWAFSSQIGRTLRLAVASDVLADSEVAELEGARRLKAQHGAFSIVADTLVRLTREQAT